MGERSNKAKKFKNTFEISYEDFLKTRFHAFLGIIQKFIAEFGEERVIPLVSEYMAETAVNSIKEEVQKNPIRNFSQFKIMFMKMINSEFMKNTTTYKIVEDSEDEFKISYTKCLWAKIFEEFGFDREQGYDICCKADFVIANTFHPKIKLSRTKTIM